MSGWRRLPRLVTAILAIVVAFRAVPVRGAASCAAKKETAAANYVRALVRCNLSAGSGVELEPRCAEVARAKLELDFSTAESAGDCASLGDASAVIANIEAAYTDLAADIPAAAETCDNGIDDDGDDDSDCADSDCFGTESCNTCGNGVVEAPAEECDGSNLGGATCVTTEMGSLFTGGTLRCDVDTCQFDISACVPADPALFTTFYLDAEDPSVTSTSSTTQTTVTSTTVTTTTAAPSTTTTTTPPTVTSAYPIVDIASTPSGDGYWLVAKDGGVFTFGNANFHGSLGSSSIGTTIVGMARSASGGGYWLAGANGTVWRFGDAPARGSQAGVNNISGITSTSANGYYLVGTDGGVFSFGATFHGSLPGSHIVPNASIIGIASRPQGDGYWLLGRDGGVFAFGNAVYRGRPTVSNASAIAATATGKGYWVVTTTGQVYSYGDAQVVSPLSGVSTIVALSRGPAGGGVWLVGCGGRVYPLGGAPYLGRASYSCSSAAY